MRETVSSRVQAFSSMQYSLNKGLQTVGIRELEGSAVAQSVQLQTQLDTWSPAGHLGRFNLMVGRSGGKRAVNVRQLALGRAAEDGAAWVISGISQAGGNIPTWFLGDPRPRKLWSLDPNSNHLPRIAIFLTFLRQFNMPLSMWDVTADAWEKTVS
jgi:hypothetical protein